MKVLLVISVLIYCTQAVSFVDLVKEEWEAFKVSLNWIFYKILDKFQDSSRISVRNFLMINQKYFHISLLFSYSRDH